MDYRKQVSDSLTTIQRNIVTLKSGVERHELSKGQAKFLEVYLDIINDHIKKSVDVLDIKKYKDMLEELEI